MTDPLATYTFLPWLRQGLSNSITQDEAAANPGLRPSVAVQLTLRSEAVGAAVPDANLATTTVRLYGPGDVLGMEARAVFKTEPKHWITNFEPNNLAHVEFYDEDFPWRYTPAHANAASHRHQPWIMLVVLEEGEFTEGNAQGRPLAVHRPRRPDEAARQGRAVGLGARPRQPQPRRRLDRDRERRRRAPSRTG